MSLKNPTILFLLHFPHSLSPSFLHQQVYRLQKLVLQVLFVLNNVEKFTSNRSIVIEIDNYVLACFLQLFNKKSPTMQQLEDTSTKFSVTLAIIGYSLCSSTLLLANKLSLEHLPLPSVVSFIQILSSTVFILVIKFAGVKVDELEWDKIKAYSLYIVAFVSCIYANMQALRHSNVETVIVFRACSPMAVSLIEYLFMDRTWPSLRSTLSLATVAFGAVTYCQSDSQLALQGWSACKLSLHQHLLHQL